MSIGKALEELIQMSKYAGERFDLVQAGGGNTSVKFDDNSMYIKASGYLLSELSHHKGHTMVALDKVLAILENEEILKTKEKNKRDHIASEQLSKAILQGTDRPSIETFLHALLYKYTLHVHAISVNVFTSQKNWSEELKELDEAALCIPYETPGIELAILMKMQLESYELQHNKLPNTIFLQNHGLIISSDRFEDIQLWTDDIVRKAELRAGVDFSRYRCTNALSTCFNRVFSTNDIAYLSEDHTIKNLLDSVDKVHLARPFSPDGFVFCGYTTLPLTDLEDSPFKTYQLKYNDRPKIVTYKGNLYIFAADLKKAKMMEDVLKNNLLIASSLEHKLTYLEEDEIAYLGNWDAEKYRQELP